MENSAEILDKLLPTVVALLIAVYMIKILRYKKSGKLNSKESSPPSKNRIIFIYFVHLVFYLYMILSLFINPEEGAMSGLMLIVIPVIGFFLITPLSMLLLPIGYKIRAVGISVSFYIVSFLLTLALLFFFK